MDTKEFIKECERMCKHYDRCKGCRFDEENYDCPDSYDLADFIVEVEQWSKEHPMVTNGDKVMEIIKDAGVPVTARGSGFDR